jgi:adenine deaminase
VKVDLSRVLAKIALVERHRGGRRSDRPRRTPLAGLMSNELAPIVALKSAKLLRDFREIGCTLNNANMQLSLLALVVIPELRISVLELVDVSKFELISVFE